LSLVPGVGGDFSFDAPRPADFCGLTVVSDADILYCWRNGTPVVAAVRLWRQVGSACRVIWATLQSATPAALAGFFARPASMAA
jgi:hypothetical protein